MSDTPAFTRLHSLATLIFQRREAGEPPYVVVLGAGASLASGAASTTQIIETVVREHSHAYQEGLSLQQLLTAFYEELDKVGPSERYLILSRYLEATSPSRGYHHLAALVKENYFDLILSTNFDLCVESSLLDTGVGAREFTVLINGQDREEQIIAALGYKTPRVKLFKLHGDLNARIFAFTPEEIFQFTDRIEQALTDILRRDLIVVGHSFRDDDLNRCIRAGQGAGALWYVNPAEPSISDFVGRAIRARGTNDHFISGELGRFEDFFSWLHLDLLLRRPAKRKTEDESELLADLDRYRRLADLRSMALTLESLGKEYAASGENEKAELSYEISANTMESLDDLQHAARIWLSLGNFHAQLNRPEEALRCYRSSQELCKRAGDERCLAQSLAVIGQWWRAMSEPQKAIDHWEQASKLSAGLNSSELERVSRWLKEAREKKG